MRNGPLEIVTGALLAALLLAPSIYAQDLPNGDGKELVLKVCTQCHDLERIITKQRTKEEWNDTVDKMAARGARASDEEFDKIVGYLTKFFGKNPPPDKSN